MIDEKTYEIIMDIENTALNLNGILWGPYVSNRLLYSYYSNKYYNEDLPIDKFWDPEFNIETIDRIFNYIEIKIVFYQVQNYNLFWDICCKKNITITYDKNYYMYIEEYPQIKIYIILNNEYELPPFKDITYLSDGFIMYKKKGIISIEYSKNTGTLFDYLSDKKFKIVEENIIKELYKKTTTIINFDKCNIQDLYKNIKNGWIYSNLPYSIFPKDYDISNNELSKFHDNNCLICLDALFKNNKSNDEIAIIYENIYNPDNIYYPLHHKCLIEYILNKNKIIFECPYRFIIDFNDCEKLINYNYYMINSNKKKFIIY